MKQTLYTIDLEVGGVDLFGPAGVIFWLWIALGIGFFARRLYRYGLDNETTWGMIAWAGVALLLAVVPGIGFIEERGGIPIFGYGAMLFVGFLVATWAAARRARRAGIAGEAIWDLAIWMFLGGIVGGRLFYIAQYTDQFREDGTLSFERIVNLSNGGLVLYGGIMGGLAAGLIYGFRKGLPKLKVADIVAPSIALALVFGRFGCFLNGCCYGDVSTAPWAVAFPGRQEDAEGNVTPGPAVFEEQVRRGLIEPDASTSLPVHPTQLYSSLNALLLYLVLSAYYRRHRRHGQVIALLATLYPIGRFLIEFLRSDESPVLLGLTISQNLSLVVCAGGLLLWWISSRNPEFRRADRAVHPVPMAA